MGNEVEADTDGMRSCAAQVTDCGERIGEALEAANAGTAITENAFGKLLFFVPSLFLNAQASAVRGIQGLGNVVCSVGEAVNDSATNYDTSDESASQRMTGLGAEIE